MIPRASIPALFAGPDVTTSDAVRLSGQLARVRALMADGEWRKLSEIAHECGCSEAGASARLRDLRKAKWGGHTVERRKTVVVGVFEYRIGGGAECC